MPDTKHITSGPLAGASPLPSGGASAAPEKRPVLVVDDDEFIRGFVKFGLSQFGYTVDGASSAAEGREMLSQKKYGLVLCDYEMPGGSGLELLTYCNRVLPHLPFIIITGHDETSLARSSIAMGAADFISKPFELRQLARMIEQSQARVEREQAWCTQITQDVMHGTIRALVAAVDAKDPYTASHSERVSKYALILGEAIGLSTERLQVLEFSALLHDVGKIALPERVLLKRTALTAEDWEYIRQHPVHSQQIVEKVPTLEEVAIIVRHHHERVDGGGYPDGLKGNDIPLLARLITIVDAFEAMTTDRAHRGAMHPREARAVIRDHLGTHFDRRLGLAFLNLDNLPRLGR